TSTFADAATVESELETTVEGVADLGFDIYDLSLIVNEKTYEFPMTVAEAGKQGLNISDIKSSGKYNTDDGRKAFGVYAEEIDGELWLTGYTAYMDKTPEAVAGGISWSELTHGDVVSMLSDVLWINLKQGDGNSIVIAYDFREHLKWEFWFESEADDAALEHLSMTDLIPSEYGTVFGERAGVTDDNLPEVTSMRYDEFILDGKLYTQESNVDELLNNGFVLKSVDPDYSMAASSGGSKFYAGTVWGETDEIYNGIGFAQIGAYNYSTEKAPFRECKLNSISVSSYDNMELIVADGITFGSSAEEVKAAFGTPTENNETAKGTEVKIYEYEVLNGITYEFDFVEDALIYISINNFQH
ncbi:MAG: hypothetical protein Q4B09_04300, partial [Lachnospiraceae bacterium]|nr:hypothetical protein [Lachnospiraceae bacterium]